MHPLTVARRNDFRTCSELSQSHMLSESYAYAGLDRALEDWLAWKSSFHTTETTLPTLNRGAHRMGAEDVKASADALEARLSAERFGYPFVDLSTYHEDVSLWQKVPMDLIMRYRFVPLRLEGETLVVAVSNPEKYLDLDDLELTLGRPLALEVAPRPQIEAIRGVNSDSTLRTLLAAGLVEDIGRADSVGHPILYSTTFEFLQQFGLKDKQALPPLRPPETKNEC